MIPSFTLSGVLPPFDGVQGPADDRGRSPYLTSSAELVAKFATTPERNALLQGLFTYRERLRATGIDSGFQWIDGSFMEDVESTRGRAPQDIDLVTFAHRPIGIQSAAEWTQFVVANPDLFDATQYGLDAYFVDLSLEPKVVVRRTAYWFGLFSHQRITAVWKGMVQLDLAEDDAVAVALLGGAQP